jgi:hypothetical protein
MRLCIADPPYLGYASLWYGDGDLDQGGKSTLRGGAGTVRKADRHPEAEVWDDPDTHRQLVARLCKEYDGWAIAMNSSNLPDYLTWTPKPYRVAVWHEVDAMPTGARPVRTWEPVLLRIPPGRRSSAGNALPVRDVLTAPHPKIGFAGAKPAAWTRWVLDMLGYNPDTDTVDDLFHGSGAVAAEINQTTLKLEWSATS